ncbi:hypothetical protein ONE63_006204 [Megalurothrips usitatus]|uniref:Aprataxin n=1 Tax=Megalurothrips usitatus TaxID=439358 RepID=A0AAV7XZL1_9NEOP|nr:hypothetical protein ONE63_006204 [Megalurothrips usitatus]
MSKSLKRQSEDDAGNEAKKPVVGHWANGLLTAMEDPNLRIFSDSKVVVIKDKYPKAKFHFLVLPKKSIPNLSSITSKHIKLLQHIHDVGREIAEREEHKNINFRMGYHAEPSMHHLHMHVISDDFDSDSLKTKKHYNSFVTAHFIDSEKLIESVKTVGKAVTPSREECQKLLKKPLACFKCGEEMANMPKLKKHFTTHI